MAGAAVEDASIRFCRRCHRLVAAALSLSRYEARGTIRVAYAPAAMGERGPGAAPGMGRVRIPPNADQIQLLVEVPRGTSAERGAVELEALKGETVAPRNVLRVDPTTTAAVMTLTTAAGLRADGDHVLRLRHVCSREGVATQAFRVTHT